MKAAIIFAAGITILATGANAQGSNWVRGHVRSDGTYVAPHLRTNPDSSRYNNYSSSPNINPYTGRSGTVDPNPYSGYRSPYGGQSSSGSSPYGGYRSPY